MARRILPQFWFGFRPGRADGVPCPERPKTSPSEAETTYGWRVTLFDGTQTQKGDVWSFTTLPAIEVSDPNPAGWWTLDEGMGTTVGWAKADRFDVTAWTNVFGLVGPASGTRTETFFTIQVMGATGTSSPRHYGLHRYGRQHRLALSLRAKRSNL